MKKQLLTLLVLMMLPLVASADAVEIDGIYYNLISKSQSAEVAPLPSGYYSGDINIPETIEYGGVKYSVEGIAQNALRGNNVKHNTGPSTVHIPSSIKYIGNSAFSFARELKAVYITDLSSWCSINFDRNTITGAYSEQISNPLYYAQHLYLNGEEVFDLIIPKGLKEIRNEAFWGDSIFTAISIPEDVEKIGNASFGDCKGVVSISIQEGVKYIGSAAFEGCSSLSSIKIPQSVSEIGEYAFHNCTALTSVILPENISTIAGDMFSGCTSLNSFIIPDGINTIKSGAFFGCTSLSHVHIPKSVKIIYDAAFEGCTNLQKVTTDDINVWSAIKFMYGGVDWVTANPLYYAHHLFVNDKEVTEVSFSNSVDTLGFNFISCPEIKKISLPKGLKVISRDALYGCTGLADIYIPLGVTEIGIAAFMGCTGLHSINIPESVSVIGYAAFARCTSLNSIQLPMGISYIDNNTFRDCSSLTTIKLSNNLSGVGDYSFQNCSALKDLYCYTKEVPHLGTNSFANSYIEYATLHVPEEAIGKYKGSQGWSNFGTIVPLTNQEYDIKKCSKPTISYQGGKLTFNSETEGAEFLADITIADAKKYYDATISLSATYNISVYATKSGYLNSDVATATLCWIDQTPKTEGITNGVANIPANAVLIKSNEGTLNIQGLDEGTQISVYAIDGKLAGSATSQQGETNINTTLRPGSIAVVKMGDKSVKVVIK